jgi:hypothetical protein
MPFLCEQQGRGTTSVVGTTQIRAHMRSGGKKGVLRIVGEPTADQAVRVPTVSFVVPGHKASTIPPLTDAHHIGTVVRCPPATATTHTDSALALLAYRNTLGHLLLEPVDRVPGSGRARRRGARVARALQHAGGGGPAHPGAAYGAGGPPHAADGRRCRRHCARRLPLTAIHCACTLPCLCATCVTERLGQLRVRQSAVAMSKTHRSLPTAGRGPACACGPGRAPARRARPTPAPWP